MTRYEDLPEEAHQALADYDELELAAVVVDYRAAVRRVRGLAAAMRRAGESAWADGIDQVVADFTIPDPTPVVALSDMDDTATEES